MAPKNNERFARIVGEAFSALGVTQAEFNRRGGPSDTTLRKILDGSEVGISARTLNGLDRALDWTPGSAARTLTGGDPTPMSHKAGEFLTKLRHPQHANRVADALDDGDADLIGVLDELLETGQLPDGAQAQLERLRDDATIKRFPELYAALRRGGKLRVAHFGQKVYEEESHGVEAETKSAASPEAVKNEEVGSLDESELRGAADAATAASIAAAKLHVNRGVDDAK